MTIPSLKCPFCGFTSYNESDVRENYCGNCHVFIDDELARQSWEHQLEEASGSTNPEA